MGGRQVNLLLSAPLVKVSHSEKFGWIQSSNSITIRRTDEHTDKVNNNISKMLEMCGDIYLEIIAHDPSVIT